MGNIFVLLNDSFVYKKNELGMKSRIIKIRQHALHKEKKNHFKKKLREDSGKKKLWNPNERSE